jgi:hypothetical protein
MNFKRRLYPLLSTVLSFILVACAQEAAPKVTLSTDRVVHKGWVGVRGEGFTAKADIRSHLKRSDGSEFPVLPMLTDDEGRFTHEIDTLLLAPGIHELWVIDSTTGVSSNIAKFEVTLEQPRPDQ